MSFLEAISENVDIKKRLNSKINELLLDCENPDIVLILEKPVSSSQLNSINRIFNSVLGHSINLKILSALPFVPMKKDLNKKISSFYSLNKIDLKKYIKPGTKIITEGRALFSITESNDLTVNAFYDFVFNKQYFYSPDLMSYVFPVDSFYKWLFSDTFEKFFAFNQIKNAYSFKFIPERITKPNFIIIKDTNNFFKEYWGEKEIALDTETSSLDFLTGEIGILTMSFDGKTGFLLKWKDIDIKLFSDFLKNKFLILANAKYDFKFMIKQGVDRSVLYCGFDTLHAGHVLNEMRSNSLKTHSWLYTKYGGYDRELDRYIEKYKCSYLDVPNEILYEYALYDPIVTFQTYKKMKNQIIDIDKRFKDGEWSLWNYFNKIVMPYVNSFVEIEYEGIPVNWKRVKEISIELDKEIDFIKQEIYKELDIKIDKEIEENLFSIEEIEKAEINIDSGKELGEYLEDIGWDNKGKGKADYYLTNDDNLNKWLDNSKSKKGAELLLKYRELNTLQKMFIGHEEHNSGVWKYRRPDNKIYPEYMVMLTNSGRNRSKNPNFQFWPLHGDWAKKIRSIFTVPSEDYLFAEVDYAGLQLRIGSIYSDDRNMRKAFVELSGDLHSVTAQQIFKKDVSLEEFLKRKKEPEFDKIRYNAKRCNFALEFGQVSFAFAKKFIEMEWSIEEAKDYVRQNNLKDKYKKFLGLLYDDRDKMFKTIYNKEEFAYYWAVAADIRNKFFETYSGLGLWHKVNHKFAEENGYIWSTFGLVRRLPQLMYIGRDDSKSIIKNLHNISLNSPVQAFEIAIVAMGMIGVYNYIKERKLKSKICGTIHDSCLFFIHRDEIDIMKKIIIQEFTKAREEYKGIPIEAEGKISDIKKGEVWGFGQKWFDSAKEKL